MLIKKTIGMVLKGANELLTNFLSISSVNNFLTIQKDIVKSDTTEFKTKLAEILSLSTCIE